MPNERWRRVRVQGGGGVRPDRAAQFTGGPYLVHTQTAAEFSVPANTDMTLDLWFLFDTITPAAAHYLCGVSGGFPLDGWWLDLDGTSGKVTYHYYNGSSYKTIGTITPTAGVWYHGRFSYNHTGVILSAVVQDTVGVLFSGTTAPVGQMAVSTLPFRIGWDANGGAPLIGRIDSLCVMSRLLVGGDLDLYNSGAGRRYADLVGDPILIGMTAWYDLDDKAGASTWLDAHTGKYHALASAGVVGSAAKRGS